MSGNADQSRSLSVKGFNHRGLQAYRSRVALTVMLCIALPVVIVTGIYLLCPGISSAVALMAAVILAAAAMAAAHVFISRALAPFIDVASAMRLYLTNGSIAGLSPRAGKGKDAVSDMLEDSHYLMRKLDRATGQLATFDSVTALPNKVVFLRDLAHLCAEGHPFGIAVFGMRNAEEVMKPFSSGRLDAVMLAYADRLESELEGLKLYRIDPVNFMFTVSREILNHNWSERLDALLASLPDRIVMDDIVVRPEYSLGAAHYPDSGTTAEALLKNALMAQVKASRETGSHVSIYAAPVQAKVFNSDMTEKGLRRALEKGEFMLHFQPVVDIRLEDVVAVEALIRWNDPERGMVAPGQFIGVAEETGLIDQITMWVLYSACKTLRTWANSDMGNVKISINLSARMLLDHDIVSEIAHALQVNRIDPSKLEIELTETGAMRDKEATFRVLSELRALGVRVALDDFGTGYSGATYLKTMPFDLLKIDREFVKDLDKSPKSRAMCKTMIDMAKNLGIEVLAEGVERPEEAAQLVSMGCAMFQGFYFARPNTPEGLSAILHDNDFKLRMRQFNSLFETVNPILIPSQKPLTHL